MFNSPCTNKGMGAVVVIRQPMLGAKILWIKGRYSDALQQHSRKHLGIAVKGNAFASFCHIPFFLRLPLHTKRA